MAAASVRGAITGPAVPLPDWTLPFLPSCTQAVPPLQSRVVTEEYELRKKNSLTQRK